MRFPPTIGCLAIVVTIAALPALAQTQDTVLPETVQTEDATLPVVVESDDPAFEALRTAARRDLEIAKLELRLFLQVDYPRQQRELNAAIRLTEAEIAAGKERLRAYGPYSGFSTGDPFLVTLQQEKLALLDAELRLRNLQAERNALVRFRSDQWRLLELKVQQARQRVLALEGGGTEIILETST